MSEPTTSAGPASAGATSAGAGPSGFHRVNVFQLVLGVVFAGLAAVWLLRATGVATAPDLHWLLPLPLLAGGASGLVAVALPDRHRRPDTGRVSAPAPTPTPTTDPEEPR